MRILHTSDWHLGRRLYGRFRYQEFEAFLHWLEDTIRLHEIDTLLVAGDIFDTNTPSNRAQELYYRFLCRVAESPCRHVVVIAGNHDSPTFLNAPRELLKALQVHVIGNITENIDDEVLVLRNQQGCPELIVCAVPYLRDRDIRRTEAGESGQDKARNLMEGIEAHYTEIASKAEERRLEHGTGIPVVAMGHLFTAGGRTIDGDGVRELYVGSLAHVSAGIFPDCFDYVALGHLHVPQKVRDSETIRYCGSPLPMGFGEAKQQKSVCQVEFHDRTATVKLISVPMFQKLERVSGDWEKIARVLDRLSGENSRCWLEIVYDGDDVIGDLRDRLDELVSGTDMEILRIKNNRIIDRVLRPTDEGETLDDLNEDQVFVRCLDAHDVPENQRPELIDAFRETLLSLRETDT